jgi:ankyrin repeat protein
MYGVCSTSLYGNPLCYASMRGDLELMRMLLEHGLDVEANDDDHRTALDVGMVIT